MVVGGLEHGGQKSKIFNFEGLKVWAPKVLRNDIKDIFEMILVLFDAFLKSLSMRRVPSKTQKEEGEKESGGCGGAAPAKNLIFEHFYVVLRPFEVGNRLLSARTLRSAIFTAIRPLDIDFQNLG